MPIHKMYLCQKYARMKLEDIGTYFGVGQSGVCQAARRVTARMKTDRRLKKRIDAMEKRFQS
jgi:chromosomal replication initiation ATPase DnaA